MKNTTIACRTAAAAAMLLGLTGLAGWVFDSETLKCLIHGWVAMKANAAALLALCGAALLLICAKPGEPCYALRKRAAFFLAAVAVLVGFFTILEYIYGFNFGLDQVLFREDAGAAFTAYPGRMAAATALCFILTGLGILLAELRVKRWTFSASEKIGLAVLLIAFHSLLGYIFGLASHTLSNRVTPMAPHAAAAFMFLGLGLILVRPGGFVSVMRGNGIARMLIVLTLPAAFIVPAAFGWLRLLGEKLGFYDVSLGVAFSATFATAALITVILYAVKVVRKMGEDLQVTQFSVDNAVDAVLWSGPDGRILYANKAAGALLGYTLEEMIGMSVTDIAAIYKTQSWEEHWAALKNKGSLKYETEYLAKDGSLKPVEVNSGYLNPDGREYKCVYARDLTARRQAQQALRESEYKFRTLVENLPQKIFLKDREFKWVSVSDNFAKDLGIRPEEIAGKVDADFFPPELAAKYHADDVRIMETGKTEELEEMYILDGRETWVSTVKTPVRNTNGEISGVLGIFWDITERKKAEAALAESEKWFKALFSNARDAIYVSHVNNDGTPGKFIEANDLACERMRMSREELLKLSATDLLDGDSNAEMPKILPQIAGKGHLTFETKVISKDGRTIPEEVSLQRLELSGVPVYITIARDITERKHAEAALLKAKAEAEAANRAKRNFLSKMSHEIRTPMNAILGFSQLMRRDPAATGTQCQRLDIINRSGEHLLELINEVLEISRIESGRLTLNEAAFDLHSMLEDLEKMFMAKAEAKDLRMELEILKGVPRFVYGDQGKLRQVISNIVGNAVKFTAHGGVSLRLRAEGLGGARFRVEAEVQDSGPGMTPEETASLFKPFEQTQAGRNEGSGTGLGLTISRDYARLMGGGVEVASRPGEGCTFKISVIMEEAGQADIAAAPALQHVKALKPGQPPCRVLIADDKEDNRTFLSELLGLVGFETRAVADGAQALKEFEAWLPQVVLMDLRMPGLDGHEIIKRLRAMKNGKDVKIIAVSASAFTEVQQEARASGADEFIAKPFRETELFEKIGKLTGVQYIYEDQPGPVPAAVEEPLAADLFAGCPAALLNQIREAALACDFDAITGLADQVEPVNLKAAQGLRTLAQKYDHKSILNTVPEGKP